MAAHIDAEISRLEGECAQLQNTLRHITSTPAVPHQNFPVDSVVTSSVVPLEEEFSQLPVRRSEHQVSSAPPNEHVVRSKPPKIVYDGTSDWEDYFFQFERIAKYHGWCDESEKHQMLIERLKGNALAVVIGVEDSYDALVAKLKATFAPDMVQTARSELRARKQKPGETYEALASELERRVRRAWPEADMKMQEVLKVESFKSALTDKEVKFQVLLREYSTLAELTVEARKIKSAREQLEPTTERSRQLARADECGEGASGIMPTSSPNTLVTRVAELTEQVRQLEVRQPKSATSKAPRDSTEQLCRTVEKLTQTVSKLGSNQPGRHKQRQGHRQVPTCYKCGRKGHVRAWCEFNSPPVVDAAVTAVPTFPSVAETTPVPVSSAPPSLN